MVEELIGGFDHSDDEDILVLVDELRRVDDLIAEGRGREAGNPNARPFCATRRPGETMH